MNEYKQIKKRAESLNITTLLTIELRKADDKIEQLEKEIKELKILIKNNGKLL